MIYLIPVKGVLVKHNHSIIDINFIGILKICKIQDGLKCGENLLRYPVNLVGGAAAASAAWRSL